MTRLVILSSLAAGAITLAAGVVAYDRFYSRPSVGVDDFCWVVGRTALSAMYSHYAGVHIDRMLENYSEDQTTFPPDLSEAQIKVIERAYREPLRRTGQGDHPEQFAATSELECRLSF